MRILLAVDGSGPSDAAARAVAQRPWPAGSSVRVLAVAQPAYPPGELSFIAATYERMEKELVQEAKAIAARAASDLRSSGMAVESVVKKGDARGEIVEEAKRWGADLVVLGSRGRTGVKRWLMGSVAEHVVRNAPCSVEVVRTPIKPAAAQERAGPGSRGPRGRSPSPPRGAT